MRPSPSPYPPYDAGNTMNARAYFDLTDAIAAAGNAAALDRVLERVSATAMHPSERRTIERVMRSRADTLRRGDGVATDAPDTDH
jgi:hypothetical protein